MCLKCKSSSVVLLQSIQFILNDHSSVLITSRLRVDQDCQKQSEEFVYIVNPEGSMVTQYNTRNHFNTHVHDSDATLARHIARSDAIATSCGSASLWQSLNRAAHWVLDRV